MLSPEANDCLHEQKLAPPFGGGLFYAPEEKIVHRMGGPHTILAVMSGAGYVRRP